MANVFLMGAGVFVPFLIILILFLVFWIMMLVDSLTRNFKEGTERIAWILVLIFLNLLGAFIYYFVIYLRDKKKSTRWLWLTMLIAFIVFLLAVLLSGIFLYSNYSPIY